MGSNKTLDHETPMRHALNKVTEVTSLYQVIANKVQGGHH